MAKPLVVIDQGYLKHLPGESHPERPERIQALLNLAGALDNQMFELPSPRAATRADVERIFELGFYGNIVMDLLLFVAYPLFALRADAAFSLRSRRSTKAVEGTEVPYPADPQRAARNSARTTSSGRTLLDRRSSAVP